MLMYPSVYGNVITHFFMYACMLVTHTLIYFSEFESMHVCAYVCMHVYSSVCSTVFTRVGTRACTRLSSYA